MSNEKIILIDQENFFALGELLKQDFPQINLENFSPLPIKTILDRWLDYYRELFFFGREYGFIPRYRNEKLSLILARLQNKVQEHNEKDAARVLGCLCGKAFIGPKRLLFDPNTACNLNCMYCRLHSPLRQKNRDEYLQSRGWSLESKFDWELLKKTLRQAAELGIEEICLVGSGEPTLYPQFAELVAEIRSKGMVLNFSTNGLRLEPELNTQLVKYDVNRITISVSGLDEKDYRIIHPTAPRGIYHKLRANIINLNRQKEKARRESPSSVYMKTDVLHVVHAFNYKKILRMVSDAKELGADRIWFQLLHVSDFNRYLRLKSEHIAETRFLLSEAKKLAAAIDLDVADFMDLQLEHVRSDGTWSKNIFENFGCLVGWYFSYINVAGEISFCCGNKIIDDLKTMDYKTLWQSPLYDIWRKKARQFDWNDNITGKNNNKLLDEFCFNCDNHNFNSEMLQLLKDFQLSEMLPDKKSIAPTQPKTHLIENRRNNTGWYLNVSLTENCQFQCRFCDTWKNKPDLNKELNTAQWLEAIATFHSLSPQARINFSGGEPLLKKELAEILRFCHYSGIKTSISTNGGAFNEKKAAEIACSGIDIIGISVDGYGNLHDELRGFPGAFSRIQQAIKWIRHDNRNSEINLLTIIMKDNLNDIRKIVQWADEDENITHVHFQALSVLKDSNEKISDHPLWPEKDLVLELMDELIAHRQNQEDKNIRPCTISNIVPQLKAMRKYFLNPDCFADQICTIYKSGYTLNAQGELFFCPFMSSIGNITKEPLAEILSEPRLEAQRQKIHACKNTACHLRINCCFEA